MCWPWLPITVGHVCGRFVGSFSTEDIVNELSDVLDTAGIEVDLPDMEMPLFRNFYVAPTTPIPILRVVEGVLRVDIVQWGLVPVWSKDASRASSMINARSETITEKPSFKGLVSGHRCIIPMSGFYEWDRTNPKDKVPYYVTRADGHLMLGAGLWSDSPLVVAGRSCALITRDSVDDLTRIHDRSPVEFYAQDALEWMMSEVPPLELFQPDHQPRFVTRQVSKRVNSVRNNDASLINEEKPEPPSDLTLF